MESNVILPTKRHAGIFKHSVIATNLRQRVSMLTDMKEKMSSPTGSKYSFRNGRNSWTGWQHGTRTSRSTYRHQGRESESLPGSMTSPCFMLTTDGKKGGITKTPALNLMRRVKVHP